MRPIRLYKYLVPDRIDVLKHQQVRFTQPDALNDPFELKLVLERILDSEDAWGFVDEDQVDLEIEKCYAELPEAIRAVIPQSWLVSRLRSSAGRQEFSELFELEIDTLNEMTPRFEKDFHDRVSKRIGMLSLSEAPDSGAMWAHYADNRQGFLIEFNAAAPFFSRRRSPNDELYQLRRVKYRESRSIPSLLKVSGDDVLLVKDQSWSYEREWRMLAPLNDAEEVKNVEGDEIYLFALPPDCITGLILGAKSSSRLQSDLEQICAASEYAHCRLGQVEVGRGDLQIVWVKS